jgi:hypothetical protein
MMAGDEELLPVDDKAIFEAAIGDNPPAEPPDKPQAEPELKDERPRDEAGRFVSKAPDAETPAPVAPGEKPTAEEPLSSADAIPSWRLREETERRRAAEERFAATQAQLQQLLYEQRRQQQQQQPEPEQLPDPIEDPAGFRQGIIRQQQQLAAHLWQQFKQQQIAYSLHRADQTHGEEFREAYKAFDAPERAGDTQLLERVRNSFDPAEEIMAWHRRERTLQEVGSDPKAYREKLQAELLNDPAFRQKAMESWRSEASRNPARGPSSVTPLPNLTRAPGSAGMSEETLPVSDADFFADAVRPMQRRR